MSRQNQNSGLQTNRNREESRRLDTDTKLALVQSIRMQSQFNRNQCRERERFLYGNYVAGNEGRSELFASEDSLCMPGRIGMGNKAEEAGAEGGFFSGFRLRFLLAVILFGIFIYADSRQISIFEKSTEEICNMIEDSDWLTGLSEEMN